MIVNINQMVKIRLTERGIKYAIGRIPNFVMDDGGLVKMQLWSFMHYFGDVCIAGAPQYFETEIEVFTSET